MYSDVAIKIKSLSKCYQIYTKPTARLKQFIFPNIRRAFGLSEINYYKEFWAVDDINFEVKKGETIGIIGRNGSGKSTLLQMICGTINPTQGEISTVGRIAALLELGSGFNPEFTGVENIYLNAAVLGLRREEIEQRFKSIAEFADIGDFINQPVKTYSSGMMVRLAFAVIAHVDADILIIDEALAVGDAFFTQKCMRFIRQYQSNGGTLLFVSHDAGAVVNLCNKAILLNQGKLIQIGSPKEVTESYLATLYASNQEVEGIQQEINIEDSYSDKEGCERDMRTELFNGSTLRNDIQVFKFESNLDGFGAGGARINHVRLTDQNGNPYTWIVGGENVILEIRCIALAALMNPIVGFQFKDRLGQVVFSDNTYISYKNKNVVVDVGQELVAMFEFRMPILPCGEYSISPAIAEGTQDEHIQHHWMHDAIIISVQSSAVCLGLVGIPMKNIELRIR